MPEINSNQPYGCHNRKPFKAEVFVQDGYAHIGGNSQDGVQFTPKFKSVPFRMTTTCQYDKSGEDPRCVGCKHHNPENAEKFALKHEGGAIWKLLGISKELWSEFQTWRKSK